LNSMQDKGAGFGTDTNKITVLKRDGGIEQFNLKSKTAVAQDICDLIVQHQQDLSSL